MSPATYNKIRFIPPLQPYEIKYLREKMGWSRAKLARFLGRDTATVFRWETGNHTIDALTSGALLSLWEQVLGPYDGPYQNPYEEFELQRSQDAIASLGQVLLAGGVAFFLAKGIEAFLTDDDDG